MARTKATAMFWVKTGNNWNPRPSSRSKPPGELRRSGRVRKQQEAKSKPGLTPSESWKPLADPNPQPDSLLLSLLPLELRREIYILALTASFVPKPPSRDAPGDLALGQAQNTSRHISTALLLTCRQVYNEAARLAVAANAHILWYDGYIALTFPIPHVAARYFARMAPWQLGEVRHVHIYAERARLQSRNPGEYPSHSAWAELACLRRRAFSPFLPSAVYAQAHPRDMAEQMARGAPLPRELTVTIRHHMWNWRSYGGSNEPGEPGWMLGNSDWSSVLGGVRRLRARWEVESEFAEWMRPKVGALRGYVFDVGDGEQLVCQEGAAGGEGSEGQVNEWTQKGVIFRSWMRAVAAQCGETTVFELEWRLREQPAYSTV